jgi:heme exporter protein D
MSEFFAMGGHGFYIWTAYAVFVLILIVDAIAPIVRSRKTLQDLRNRYRREQTRKERP